MEQLNQQSLLSGESRTKIIEKALRNYLSSNSLDAQ